MKPDRLAGHSSSPAGQGRVIAGKSVATAITLAPRRSRQQERNLAEHLASAGQDCDPVSLRLGHAGGALPERI